jgi:hypothetical protein
MYVIHQEFFFKVSVLGTTNLPWNLTTFHILMETSDFWVSFLDSSLNMTHTFISLLSSYDLVPQGRREADVEQ